jgi:hypothetical protein
MSEPLARGAVVVWVDFSPTAGNEQIDQWLRDFIGL